MNFEEIWERIKRKTEVKKLSELAKLVGTTSQYVSKKKKDNEFPPGWAYKVGKKYGILTEWIMTGEGPEKNNESNGDDFFLEIQKWGKEMSGSENIDWMKKQIENHFPGFKEWKKRKAQGNIDESDFPSSKVA